MNANDRQTLDLYRNPLSTPHPPRLPSHILWFLSQGMVLIASLPSGSLKIESVQLPVMSRPSEGDATERYGHHVVGDVPPGEPGKSADWRGERRD